MNQAAADFFANLPSDKDEEKPYDMFKEAEPEKDKTPETQAAQDIEKEEKVEEQPERKKPLRSERRMEKQTEFLQQKWEEEREARIRLEEQVKALGETRKAPADPDIKRLLTETKDPEEATRIFQDLLEKVGKDSEDRAFERFQRAQQEGDKEVDALHASIEDSLEDIEEHYGADLSKKETRDGFLDFVEAIAPEDSDALPNMRKAWELYQATQKAPAANTERKAAISTRSLARSTQSVPEGKNLKPMSFESMNRGNWWDKVIGNKG